MLGDRVLVCTRPWPNLSTSLKFSFFWGISAWWAGEERFGVALLQIQKLGVASTTWSLSLSHCLGTIYPAQISSLSILHLYPRPSFSLLNQEHPGETPGKWFMNISPLSFFASSINPKLASLRQCQAQPQALHVQIAITGPALPPVSTYPVPGGPPWSTPKPPEPFPALQSIYLRLNSISGSSLISLCVGARMRSFVLILN